ncbi:hypothetical protein OAX78_02205 [Planctomycetota bacterium]|nr:hypothetical protein [Planctomycetota bacterium]
MVRLSNGDLRVDGPFKVRSRLEIDRSRGIRFTEATGDPNPIHREGDVIPGALIAAEFVSAAEILFPHLQLTSLRTTFTAVSWYDRPVRLLLDCKPTEIDGEPGLEVKASAFQGDRECANGLVKGRFVEELQRHELPPHKINVDWLARVVSFYDSLGIKPQAYLEKAEGPDYSYPTAFLASLPSGSMVQRFQGEGGILNRLNLEFTGKLPLAGPPEVSLELPARLRKSFNKIMTFVKEGVETAVRGSALVLPRPPEDLLEQARRDRHI